MKEVRLYPVEVKDNDQFLHGTSSKRYLSIKSSGFLLRKNVDKNYPISHPGAIYFEKYDRAGTYAGLNAGEFIEKCISDHCRVSCKRDKSSEAVILQITGKELKKLGCTIYVDRNKNLPLKRSESGEAIRPLIVDSNYPVFSIMIVDKDIPFEYLKIFKKIPFKE